MTREQLQALFPNATEDFLRANAERVSADLRDRCPGPSAELEPDPGDEPLAAPQLQKEGAAKFLVRLTGCQRKPIDEDNLCEKFIVDCCRYAGLLPDDDPASAHIEVTQLQVGPDDPEFTRIQIWRLA